MYEPFRETVGSDVVLVTCPGERYMLRRVVLRLISEIAILRFRREGTISLIVKDEGDM